mmetsp:Transcript_13830/g.34090  ORF Transcript_13830/g.34090 Transcript_13830/m.34090 type:complete len:409 (-) Transcript_13830:127-1353(-)
MEVHGPQDDLLHFRREMDGEAFAFGADILAAVYEDRDGQRFIAIEKLKAGIAQHWREIGCSERIHKEQLQLLATPAAALHIQSLAANSAAPATPVDCDALKVPLDDELVLPLQYFVAGDEAFEEIGFGVRFFEPFTSRETLDDAVWCIALGMRPCARETDQEAMKELETKHGPLRIWDVSAVADLSDLFDLNEVVVRDRQEGTQAVWVRRDRDDETDFFHFLIFTFNPDVSGWKTTGVGAMRWMFNGREGFSCDLSGWDVSAVKSMAGMFAQCRNFSGDSLACWNTSNCENMSNVFNGAGRFTQSLRWDCSSCTTMNNMFSHCAGFSAGARLEFWNTGGVRDVGWMFSDVDEFPEFSCVCEWDLTSVIAFDAMFSECPSVDGVPAAEEKFLAAGWSRRTLTQACIGIA